MHNASGPDLANRSSAADKIAWSACSLRGRPGRRGSVVRLTGWLSAGTAVANADASRAGERLGIGCPGCSDAARFRDRLQRDVQDGVIQHDRGETDDQDAENEPSAPLDGRAVHACLREALATSAALCSVARETRYETASYRHGGRC